MSDIPQMVCVGLTLLLAGWELKASLDAAAPRPRARPSPELRGPDCHEALARAPALERVRCRGCGTRHHATCWIEHEGCSVHGCGAARPATPAAAALATPADGAVPADDEDQPAAPPVEPTAAPAASCG
ncbi:MAG: hypothetical protein KIT58_24690 [Planctomycetota bacterium]|nr:hypothetical protein [Planctomycetota bacterium]